MPSKNKIISLLIPLGLALFALQASADNKNFGIAVPASVPVGTSFTTTITFTNAANGNSTFNSIELDVLSGNLSISAASAGSGSPAPSTVSPHQVIFTSLSPVKVGKSIVVTLTVTTTNATCSASTVTWDAKAWTGSPSSPSSVFALTTPKPIVTMITPPACTLGFVPQPTGALKNATITGVPSDPSGAPVGVALFQGATQVTSFTGPITLAIKSGTGAAGAVLSGGGPVNAVAGLASFPSLSIDKTGMNYVLTASSPNLTSVDSTAFTIFDGVLGCDPMSDNFAGNAALDPTLSGPFVGTPGFGMRRGPNLDDLTGANCVKVDFTFAFNPDGNSASLLYDKAAGPPPQKAQFEYVLLWTPIPAGPSGWPSVQPLVSWGVNNPTLPTDYVPALACLSDSDDLTEGSTLMPTVPNVPPFNTAPYAGYAQYQPGQPAKMCVAQEGWTAIGGGLIQHWTKVIDQSDGYVRLP